MTRRAPHDVVPHVLVAGLVISLATAFFILRVSGPLAADDRQYRFWLNIIYWLLWTGLAPLVLLLSARFPLSAPRRGRHLGIHLAAGVGFGVSHLALLQVLAGVIRSLVSHQTFRVAYGALPAPARLHIEWEITMYWALVGLAHAMMFRAEARERTLRAAQLEAQLAQAQLRALQRQLQPHFLFNTLQTISALVHRDVREADRMIERLGDLLRMTLGAGELLQVPLSRELEHVRHYAAIEQANLGSRLALAVEVSGEAMDASVPSLLLQPLVENAVRHGVAPRASGGRIAIRAWRDGGALEIRVEDDGLGFRGESRAGIGLDNTRRRLEQTYGSAHQFIIAPGAAGGTTIYLRLPFTRVTECALEEAG